MDLFHRALRWFKARNFQHVILSVAKGEQQFLTDLRSGVMAPSLMSGVILDSRIQAVSQCNAQRSPGSVAGDTFGQLEHVTWPRQWNDKLLEFMRNNPE